MADRSTRRPPTHTLIVEVPMHLEGRDTAAFDPVQDAMRVVLALSRVAAEGFICDDVQVSLVVEGERPDVAYRSAESGRFVTAEEAAANPAHTVREEG